jgi:hypothetical protein
MLNKTWHRFLAAGLLAVALIGGAIGLANAQPAPTQTPSPPHEMNRSQLRQQYVDAFAKRLGVTSTQLEQAAEGARSDVGMPSHGSGPHEADHGGMLAVAAQSIGISPEQLRAELPGKSLAQVAEAHGKNPADVAAALKKAADAQIDAHMTQVVPGGS